VRSNGKYTRIEWNYIRQTALIKTDFGIILIGASFQAFEIHSICQKHPSQSPFISDVIQAFLLGLNYYILAKIYFWRCISV
jgi:hypothetical protein